MRVTPSQGLRFPFMSTWCHEAATTLRGSKWPEQDVGAQPGSAFEQHDGSEENGASDTSQEGGDGGREEEMEFSEGNHSFSWTYLDFGNAGVEVDNG